MITRVLVSVVAALVFGGVAALVGFPWWGCLLVAWGVTAMSLLVIHVVDSLYTVAELDEVLSDLGPGV